MNKILTIDSYEPYIDGKFTVGQDIPPGQIIFVNPEDMKFFMDALPWDRKVIVVSAESDYGIHYQVENHPNKDIQKHLFAIDFRQVEQSLGYVDLIVNNRTVKNCDARDRYIVKIDRYSINTFDTIDKNIIAWYCTNSNIDEKNVHFYPFGVNKQGEGCQIVSSYYKPLNEKSNSIYANFRITSVERLILDEHYKNLSQQSDKVVYRSSHMKIDDYYEELSKHKYVICPFGNGLDSYKVYETLIVGSIPILQDNRWSRKLLTMGFNVFLVNNLANINPNIIPQLDGSATDKWNRDLLTQEFWGNKINEARKML